MNRIQQETLQYILERYRDTEELHTLQEQQLEERGHLTFETSPLGIMVAGCSDYQEDPPCYQENYNPTYPWSSEVRDQLNELCDYFGLPYLEEVGNDPTSTPHHQVGLIIQSLPFLVASLGSDFIIRLHRSYLRSSAWWGDQRSQQNLSDITPFLNRFRYEMEST